MSDQPYPKNIKQFDANITVTKLLECIDIVCEIKINKCKQYRYLHCVRNTKRYYSDKQSERVNEKTDSCLHG